VSVTSMTSQFPGTSVAAWEHRGARQGFEVAYFGPHSASHLVGCTTAIEADEAFVVDYDIELDAQWYTRSARVVSRSSGGRSTAIIEADGRGQWTVNGSSARHLDGCLDIDLESSALTNAFPVGRLQLAPGDEADAPAAYVRALDASVGRLEQRYRRLDDEGSRSRYDYYSSTFDFRCDLAYDGSGLVVDYPGIARRVR
jgi:uncharacterized protein